MTPTAAATNAAPQFIAAAPADSFVDSIGVDTHFNYGGTSYVTNFSAIAAALIGSGIRHIQDGEVNDPHAQALAYLGQAGIKHSISFPVTTTPAQIVSTINGYLPYVDFVEPQNEYDEKAASIPNWATVIKSEQQLLYSTVRSNPAYAGITVLGPAVAKPSNAAAIGPLDASEDAGQLHNYPCNYNPGTSNSAGITAVTNLLRASTQTKPIWTTEIGYADNLVQWPCAISDAEIAKFDPRTVAERWMLGEPRTYFYQFADMAPAQNYNSMGLVSTTGTPKPQYLALQSMIRLLADPGPSFQASPLAFSLGGNVSNVQQVLLQKRDGSYYVMLWLEVPGWNGTSGLPIVVAPQNVTLTFATAPASATQYSYSSNWTLQGTPLPASTTVSVPVTDAITFVHVQF